MQPQGFNTNHPEHSQSHSLAHPEKRQTFRQQIRRRQIEQIKKQIRLKYYQFKQPSDYELLRNINLTKLITDCKRYGIFDNKQHIHALFLYASSKSSDHLFSLIDDGFVEMLINGMLGVGDEGEVCWHREILWILTNYTSYSYIISDSYLSKLLAIARYIFSPMQKPHQFLEQTEQNIILSLANLVQKSKNCRYIMQQHKQLFLCIISRFIDRKPSLSERITHQPHTPKLVSYYGQFLHNLYACIEYFQMSEDDQFCMVKQVINIITSTLGDGFMRQDDKNIVLMFLSAVTRLFQNSFDRHPELILSHKKQIKRLGAWFEKFAKTQKQSSNSDEIIVAYLSFLQTVYGPNIPEDLQGKIIKFYVKYFENHVGKVCTSVFMTKKNFFHMSALHLLQPILMEQNLAERIATEYLPIVSHIFEHITNSSFALKKQALICLVNLLKSTLYQQSQSYNQVLELLLVNKVADILAYNIWCFVDEDLNYQLLQGVSILLEAEKNQYGAKLRFWELFKQAGGVLKMQAILEESSSAILKEEVNKILNSVKQIQQETAL